MPLQDFGEIRSQSPQETALGDRRSSISASRESPQALAKPENKTKNHQRVRLNVAGRQCEQCRNLSAKHIKLFDGVVKLRLAQLASGIDQIEAGAAAVDVRHLGEPRDLRS